MHKLVTGVTHVMRYRTWPVFLVGFGSLLALLLLPGITALQRTDEVYRNIRAIQSAHQTAQQRLFEIERRMYLTGILVRELLLDPSDRVADRHKTDFISSQEAVRRVIQALKREPIQESTAAVDKLEREINEYWRSIEPIFDWTAEQRKRAGLRFLRDNQRPRRQAILAATEELRSLAAAASGEQYTKVSESQLEFSSEIQRALALAFFIGVLIAAGSIFRISTLEQRSERQRLRTEKAEDELRTLSTQLMHAQEAERKRISRELHDEVGQMLTGIRMELGSLERLRQSPEQFDAHVQEAKSLTEATLRAVRDLAVGLRPSVLDLGLVPALQWQARHFSRHTGIPVNLKTFGDLDDIPEEQRTCIYRIVQESLTNSAKHGQARGVEVTIRESNRLLSVRIKDDGVGFDPAAKRNNGGGLGLLGMEERVRELGGSLRIDSHPGDGTVLAVQLGLPEATTA